MLLRPLFVCLILLVLFCPIGIDIYLPAVPLMQQVFVATSWQIQLSLTLYIVAMGAGQILVGPLVDRFGRRPVALTGISLFLLSSIAIGYSWDITQLLGLRMLQGLGASCTAIVAFTVVRDTYPSKEGAKVYTYLNGALNLVPALAPLLGGILLAWFGWRSNFYFLGIFSSLIFIAVFYWLPETRPASTVGQSTFSVGLYLDIIKNRQFLIYALCAMGGMSVILAYAFFSPIVLMVELGLSSTQFALLFGGNAVVIIISSLFVPYCIHLIGRRHSVELGSVLLLCSGVLIPILITVNGYNVIAFMLPVVIASCGFSIMLGACTSLALEPFANKAGTAAALQGSIQMLGASLFCMLASLLPMTLLASMGVLMVFFGVFGVFSKRIHGMNYLDISAN